MGYCTTWLGEGRVGVLVDWVGPITAPILKRLRLPTNLQELPKDLRHVAQEVHNERCCRGKRGDIYADFDCEPRLLIGTLGLTHHTDWWCDAPLYDNRARMT